MGIYTAMNHWLNKCHFGDCLETLRRMPDNSVDSIVTDPPYGLSFMGKKWDYDVPGVNVWTECLRVLKPGGHLLAFAGTRTQHRMACRIEDAGFEIRDMIAWVYGSGFPKSLDVGKAIDKAAGAVREVVGTKVAGWHTNNQVNDDGWTGENEGERVVSVTAANTEAARQWQGWGTALKPALEPITMARKPLIGTVACNVLAHGTGGMNIDGCRVVTDDKLGGGHSTAGQQMSGGWERPWMKDEAMVQANMERSKASIAKSEALGRWPANLIHDGSAEVTAGFPDTASGGYPPEGGKRSQVATYGAPTARGEQKFTASEGSAARFFYCAKASRDDRNSGLYSGNSPAVGTAATMREREDANWSARNGNHHPTVKPTDLMRYLCRLVTPPGGIVLDPFIGSGSTGCAAVLEGFQYVGMERDADYIEIARARIDSAQLQGYQPSLLMEAA